MERTGLQLPAGAIERGAQQNISPREQLTAGTSSGLSAERPAHAWTEIELDTPTATQLLPPIRPFASPDQILENATYHTEESPSGEGLVETHAHVEGVYLRAPSKSPATLPADDPNLELTASEIAARLSHSTPPSVTTLVEECLRSPCMGPTAPSLTIAEDLPKADEISSCCRLALNPFEDQMSHLVSPVNPHDLQRAGFQVTTSTLQFPTTTADCSPPWRRRFAVRREIGELPREQPQDFPPAPTTAAKQQLVGNLPWWAAFVRGHPLHILNSSRAFLVLPVILCLVFAALLGSDWRHVKLSYDQPPRELQSRTLLSLSAVERITETRSTNLPAAASVRELPMSYKHVRKMRADPAAGELWCDHTAHAQAAETLLGDMSTKEAIGLGAEGMSRERSGRLALYHLLHGASFRDIDCRKMRTFENVGIAVQVLLSLVLVFLASEWLIIMLHLFSPRRSADAKAALKYVCEKETRGRRHRRSETDPGRHSKCTDVENGSPPFLQPSLLLPAVTAPPLSVSVVIDNSTEGPRTGTAGQRDMSWAQIDMEPPRRGSGPWGSQLNKVRHKLPGGAARRSASARLARQSRRCCPKLLQRSARSNSVHLLGEKQRWWSGWSEYLWWRPVTQMQRVLGWTPREGKCLYFMVSFMEGSTCLLSLLQLCLVAAAVTIWITRTGLPACLNEETELTICQNGQSFTILVVALVMLLLNFYLHLASSRVCEKLANLKMSTTTTMEIPV